MGKTFSLEIGPADQGGMNTYKTPRALGPAEATTSTGVDYANGSLKGFYGPGTSIKTGLGGGDYFIHLLDIDNTWLTSQYREFACQDGTITNGSPVSYYTNVAGSSTPKMYAGANIAGKTLGRAAPSAPTLTAGSGGIARSYKITSCAYYADLNVTVESNPCTAVNSANATVTLNFTAVPANTTNITYTNRIYASNSATQTDPYYLIGTATTGATTWNDTNTAWTLPLTPLNWQSGGGPKVATYLYDHGMPPNLTIMANTLMGVPAVPVVSISGESPRGGILFGAIGSRLYWSMTGYPWYWPSLNAEELDDLIEAIVVDRASAYVLTRSGIYVISGVSDTALTISKSRAPHGCTRYGGTAAAMTPYGVIYPCREGLAIFDGQTSRILTTGVLSSGFLPSGSAPIIPMMGAYQDDLYIIGSTYGGNGGLFVDLSAYPRIRVSIADKFSGGSNGISAFCIVKTPVTTNGFPGLHVEDGSGNIKPWWPRFSRVGGSLDAWTHTTGYLDCGMPTRKKKWFRAWVPVGAGSVSVVLNAYNWPATLTGTATITASGFLPSTLIGDYLQAVITAGSGATVLHPIRLDYEVLDD